MGALSFLASCSTSKKATAAIPPFTETADMLTLSASAFSDKNYVIIQSKKFEQPIYIAKQPDGSYSALKMYCTHKGCEVKAAPDKFICPCHGSEFSLHGDVLKGPATQPMISFPVSVDENNNVIVHFS